MAQLYVLMRLLIFPIGVPSAMLTTVSSSLSGDICPLVKMTCTVQDLPSLRWFMNDSQIAAYPFNPSDTFPPPVDLMTTYPGVNAQIINATQGSNPEAINAISVLAISFTALSNLSGVAIQCGANAHKSNSIIVGDVKLLGEELL